MSEEKRIGYLDTIRFAAMFLMIVCHACDPFNAGATYGAGEANKEMLFYGAIWGSCVRACVPLFVMLTGALCLTTELPLHTFWRRRIPRVLWPFLIWAAIYNLFPWFVGLIGQPESTVHTFFVWASNTSPDLLVCLKRVAEIPFRFDNLACHLWYVYLLLGLYLVIPILAAWVRSATRRQIELVLGIWLASTFLPYMHEYVGKYLFGECEWNGFGLFHYFSGFAGYLLLGHYLVRYVPLRKISLAFALPLFALGAFISWKGFTHIVGLGNATPEQTEMFWLYCSPNVAMMSLAAFLALRLIPTAGAAAPAFRNFSICSFGVYMIHYFFVGPMYKLVVAANLPLAAWVPVSAALNLGASWLVVAGVKRLFPRTRWLLG